MPQWEYRNESGSWTHVCQMMNTLGHGLLGGGWELVSMCVTEETIHSDGPIFYCVYKRVKPD